MYFLSECYVFSVFGLDETLTRRFDDAGVEIVDGYHVVDFVRINIFRVSVQLCSSMVNKVHAKIISSCNTENNNITDVKISATAAR